MFIHSKYEFEPQSKIAEAESRVAYLVTACVSSFPVSTLEQNAVTMSELTDMTSSLLKCV